MDCIMDDINFEAPDFEIKDQCILIGKDYVREKSKRLYQNIEFHFNFFKSI